MRGGSAYSPILPTAIGEGGGGSAYSPILPTAIGEGGAQLTVLYCLLLLVRGGGLSLQSYTAYCYW